jgi:Lipopolysaccharide assembly protein A domain
VTAGTLRPAGLTGGGLLLVFMIQNTEDVKLDFLFWSFTWPLWLYTFVIAVVGALMWLGLARFVVTAAARRAAKIDGTDLPAVLTHLLVQGPRR